MIDLEEALKSIRKLVEAEEEVTEEKVQEALKPYFREILDNVEVITNES